MMFKFQHWVKCEMIFCRALEIYWIRHGVEHGMKLKLDTLQKLLGSTSYGTTQDLYKNYDLKMFVLVALTMVVCDI